MPLPYAAEDAAEGPSKIEYALGARPKPGSLRAGLGRDYPAAAAGAGAF